MTEEHKTETAVVGSKVVSQTTEGSKSKSYVDPAESKINKGSLATGVKKFRPQRKDETIQEYAKAKREFLEAENESQKGALSTK